MRTTEEDNRRETPTSPFSKNKKWWLVSILIGVDVLLIILHCGGYYLRLFPPDSLVYSMFIFNSIVLLSMGIIAKIYTIVAAFMPAVLIIFLILFLNHEINDDQFITIRSPIGNEAIVMKYTVTTLGESIYSYDFYQSLLGGLLLKELSRYSYMDHGTYDSAEDVIGMDDLEWKDKNHLVFHTPSGDLNLKLN